VDRHNGQGREKRSNGEEKGPNRPAVTLDGVHLTDRPEGQGKRKIKEKKEACEKGKRYLLRLFQELAEYKTWRRTPKQIDEWGNLEGSGEG